MKKALRIISLILIVAIMSISLSGCMVIDMVREEQAFWGEDNKIKYGEYEYMLLPESENLQPVCNELNFVYITTEDVPVLLSGAFGDRYDISDDKVFIFTDGENGYTCYCRSDRYDDIKDKITSGFKPESYCYSYFDMVDYEDRYYMFSADEVEAVNSVVKSVTPDIMPEAASLNYDYIVNVEACTKDMIFRTYIADICITGENYFVVVTEEAETLMYKVPDEQKSIFKKIMKSAVDSEAVFYEEYEDIEE